ncbi:Uncharacterised protein [Candidatus Bilamarchaeum dharawalense]|uniref:Thioredoxin domain-containing protein n=1 Tax=Candidatus Bilamarchaeum dharawalense TaxID=2885759 RepID=A0A5E4LNJ6_9ARCH|nr:Uncharacterised protein [Candidatus Bilamarchaeum dharawalense]
MKIPQSAITIGVFAVVIIVAYILLSSGPKGHYPNFAKCLTDNNVKMYGAWWCTHCADQKALLGDSWHLVNYVECSTPDGKGRTQVCIDANVSSYPTWVFQDGKRYQGPLLLDELSNRTGCALDPQN